MDKRQRSTAVNRKKLRQSTTLAKMAGKKPRVPHARLLSQLLDMLGVADNVQAGARIGRLAGIEIRADRVDRELADAKNALVEVQAQLAESLMREKTMGDALEEAFDQRDAVEVSKRRLVVHLGGFPSKTMMQRSEYNIHMLDKSKEPEYRDAILITQSTVGIDAGRGEPISREQAKRFKEGITDQVLLVVDGPTATLREWLASLSEECIAAQHKGVLG